MREELKLSAQQFADWIKQDHEIGDAKLLQLATFLEVPVERLLRPAAGSLSEIVTEIEGYARRDFWERYKLPPITEHKNLGPESAAVIRDLARALSELVQKNDFEERTTLSDRAFENIAVVRKSLPKIEDLAEETSQVLSKIRKQEGRTPGVLPSHSSRLMRIRHLRTLAQRYNIDVVFEESDRLRKHSIKSFLHTHRQGRATLYVSATQPPQSLRFEIAKHIGLSRISNAFTEQFLNAIQPLDAGYGAQLVATTRAQLASNFAAALLLPAQHFIPDLRLYRFDIKHLSNLYDASIEIVVRRTVTLSLLPKNRQPNPPLPALHGLKTDLASNLIWKLHGDEYNIVFPRTSGNCSLWGSARAFQNPGEVTRQWSDCESEKGNGKPQRFFCASFIVNSDELGFGQQGNPYAITLGCRAEDAREFVYADGFHESPVPVGVTCARCFRDCNRRAVVNIELSHRSEAYRVPGISFARKMRDCSPLTQADTRTMRAIVGKSGSGRS